MKYRPTKPVLDGVRMVTNDDTVHFTSSQPDAEQAKAALRAHVEKVGEGKPMAGISYLDK